MGSQTTTNSAADVSAASYLAMAMLSACTSEPKSECFSHTIIRRCRQAHIVFVLWLILIWVMCMALPHKWATDKIRTVTERNESAARTQTNETDHVRMLRRRRSPKNSTSRFRSKTHIRCDVWLNESGRGIDHWLFSCCTDCLCLRCVVMNWMCVMIGTTDQNASPLFAREVMDLRTEDDFYRTISIQAENNWNRTHPECWLYQFGIYEFEYAPGRE